MLRKNRDNHGSLEDENAATQKQRVYAEQQDEATIQWSRHDVVEGAPRKGRHDIGLG